MSIKRILALALALIAIFAFAACGTPTDPNSQGGGTTAITTTEDETDPIEPGSTGSSATNGKTPYTVTVTTADGTPIAGVVVQICVGEQCQMPALTDENGVLTRQIQTTGDETAYFTIIAADSPTGYNYPTEKTYFESGSTTATLVVEAAA